MFFSEFFELLFILRVDCLNAYVEEVLVQVFDAFVHVIGDLSFFAGPIAICFIVVFFAFEERVRVVCLLEFDVQLLNLLAKDAVYVAYNSFSSRSLLQFDDLLLKMRHFVVFHDQQVLVSQDVGFEFLGAVSELSAYLLENGISLLCKKLFLVLLLDDVLPDFDFIELRRRRHSKLNRNDFILLHDLALCPFLDSILSLDEVAFSSFHHDELLFELRGHFFLRLELELELLRFISEVRGIINYLGDLLHRRLKIVALFDGFYEFKEGVNFDFIQIPLLDKLANQDLSRLRIRCSHQILKLHFELRWYFILHRN